MIAGGSEAAITPMGVGGFASMRALSTRNDDPEKASDLIEALMTPGAAAINGRFLWIKDGLQAPVPSWGEVKPAEAGEV